MRSDSPEEQKATPSALMRVESKVLGKVQEEPFFKRVFLPGPGQSPGRRVSGEKSEGEP